MDTSDLDPADVCGFIEELGTEARSQSYDGAWQRDAASWRAVIKALEMVEGGRRPEKPKDRPPKWLAGLVSEHLETLLSGR